MVGIKNSKRFKNEKEIRTTDNSWAIADRGNPDPQKVP
jgi:hypothetical protein